MKVICTVSHDDPQKGPGFKKYIAGQEYDMEKPRIRFKPVNEKKEERPAPAKKREGGKGK